MAKNYSLRALALSFVMMTSAMAWSQTTISDEAGLKAIANDLAGSYVLAADITLSSEWTPIGTSEAPFTGTLDGQGHTIKGLTISSGEDNVGFFSFTDGATISSVRFTDATVNGYKQAGVVVGQATGTTIDGVYVAGVVTGYDHIGGIVGDARGAYGDGVVTIVKNCLSLAAALSTTYQAGGIAGWTNSGEFTNNITVAGVTAYNGGAGGVCGMIDNDGVASFVGNVALNGYISGGSNRTHSICAWKNGSGCAYDICEYNYATTATVYNMAGSVVTYEDLAAAHAENQEGLDGEFCAPADLKTSAKYTEAGFDASVWNLSTGSYPVLKGMTLPLDADKIVMATLPAKMAMGTSFDTEATSILGHAVKLTSSDSKVVSVDGTTLTFEATGTATVTVTSTGDDYTNGTTVTLPITVSSLNYDIATPEDLVNIKYDLEGSFRLTADIDMAGVDFTPIDGFAGTLDGQGHWIHNLTYDNENTENVGLFAVTRGATIKNLGLEGAYMHGSANTAGLVGYIYGGSVTGCAVINSVISGRDHVGAIAGNINLNGDGNYGTISDCFSDSEIYSREYQCGGILGVINAGLVQNCLFSGIVDCPSSNAAGVCSLVDSESEYNVIKNNVVAASHIYGTNFIAVTHTATRAITLENNYISDGTYMGSSAYSCSAATGLTDAASDAGSTVERSNLLTKDWYVSTLGWDFDNTWKFLAGTEGKMYPVLKWMNATMPTRIYDMPEDRNILYKNGMEYLDLSPIHASMGQNLEYSFVEETNIASFYTDDALGTTQLYAGDDSGAYNGSGDVLVKASIASDIASNFSLEGEDQFSVYIGLEGEKVQIATPEDFLKLNKNRGGAYELIADIDMAGVDFTGIAITGDAFSGTLEGNGHVVKNITVSFDSGEDKGVFGKLYGAKISNVAFVNYTVNASSCKHVGFVGKASTTTFENCAFMGTVKGDDHVAMLAGDCDGSTVNNCYIDGNSIGRSQMGGFFGCTLENGATITNSYFNGTASASYRGWVGGFIGLIDKAESEVTIKNCVSIGDCSVTGDGTPRHAAPFIAGNGAGDNPNATIYFSNNIYNASATMTADDGTDWPGNHETVEGGEVEEAVAYPVASLKEKTAYENLGWDFSSVWGFDTSNGYEFPVLKIFGDLSTGVRSVNAEVASYSVSTNGSVLNVAGVANGTSVNVATISGQSVARVKAVAGQARVNLPGRGIYVVTVSGNQTKAQTYKIVNK